VTAEPHSVKDSLPSWDAKVTAFIAVLLIGIVAIMVLISNQEPTSRTTSTTNLSRVMPDSTLGSNVEVYSPRVTPDLTPGSNVGVTEESKPPPGTDVALLQSQIRYCLAQKVRLDTMEPMIDLHSSVQVNGYNDLVDDYNRRCSSYRYRQSDMDAAKRVIEARRAILTAEARAQVLGLR
jgi:hypothetical protein